MPSDTFLCSATMTLRWRHKEIVNFYSAYYDEFEAIVWKTIKRILKDADEKIILSRM